jgi:hypothetical protein
MKGLEPRDGSVEEEKFEDIGECWRWISVNLEYLLYIGFDYDLQLTRH